MAGTFKPNGTMLGPIGTLDILVEDGRGGSVVGSLPIVVLPSASLPVFPPPPAEAPALQSRPSAMLVAPPTAAMPAALPTTSPTPPTVSGTMAASQLGGPQPAQSLTLPPSTPSPQPGSPKASPLKTETQSLLAFTSPALPSILLPSTAAPLNASEARALASGIPCALVDVREGQASNSQSRLSVSGVTLSSPAFDAFLRRLGGPNGPPVLSIKRLDNIHCPVLAVVGDIVRRSREQRPLRLVLQATSVPVGGRLGVSAQEVPNGALYVDLYSADGSVQHLRRGPLPRGPGASNVPFVVSGSGSPGLRLMVVIATPSQLNLERRPTLESDADYLPALQDALAKLGLNDFVARAEIATLTIEAAPPSAQLPPLRPIPSPHSRLPNATDTRCGNIIAQVQLGVSLSDADQKILQTSCGR